MLPNSVRGSHQILSGENAVDIFLLYGAASNLSEPNQNRILSKDNES